MQSELKPCPFCGGEAKIISPLGWGNVRAVECGNSDNCAATGPWFSDEKHAIAAWNTRASDAEITRLTEALRDAEERERVLVRLVERAQVNTPDQYVNWHEHARQALAGAKPC